MKSIEKNKTFEALSHYSRLQRCDYKIVFVLKQHINYPERLEVRRRIARVDYQALSLDSTWS